MVVNLIEELGKVKSINPIASLLGGLTVSLVTYFELQKDRGASPESQIATKVFVSKFLCDLATTLINEVSDIPEFKRLYTDYKA